MLNSTFKLVYLILFIAASVVRRIFTAKNKRHEFIQQHKSVGDTLLLLFDGIGMVILLICSNIHTSQLDGRILVYCGHGSTLSFARRKRRSYAY
jgi:hypothetical protein